MVLHCKWSIIFALLVNIEICFMCQSPSQVGGHITSGSWDCAVVNLGHVFVNTDGYIKV